MPKPWFCSCSKSIRSPEHPCPNHGSVRVPRTYGQQSTHVQTMGLFVFQDFTVTRARMPKPWFCSCSKNIRSPEHPCPNHGSVRLPRAYGDQSTHAPTMVLSVFQEHTVTRARMPKPWFCPCFKSIRCPEHACPNHGSVRVSRAYGDLSTHAQTMVLFVFQDHMVTRASMLKPWFLQCATSSLWSRILGRRWHPSADIFRF